MNRISAALIIMLCTATAGAATAPLRTLRSVHDLTNAEAKAGLPADFEATVTYYDPFGKDLFVQDGDLAIYVFATPGDSLVPGDRIRVQGKTDSDFKPDILAEHITLLNHGAPPAPTRPTFSQLIRTEFDCVRVTMQARVRSANIVRDKEETNIYLNLRVDGGYIDATVLGRDSSPLKDLLDADVEITGSVAGKFDSKMQLAGIMLEVPSLADIRIIRKASIQPAALPITPMDQILNGYSVDDRIQRVRVRGTITYYQPGTAVVLQDGERRSLWVATQYEGPLQVGEVADASGFPDIYNNYATLTESEITPAALRDPIRPLRVDWPELASGKHAFDLVSTEGEVLVAVRGAAKDEYVLESGGRLFSAIYRHPDLPASVIPAMKQVAVGSRVRVTGICTLEHGSDPLGDPVAFNVLLRGFEDVELISDPSWFSTRHLSELLVMLLALVFAVTARGWILASRVRRQTAALARQTEAEAELERRRSRILEDINSGRELTDILDQIASLVGFNVKAPCWCELANGICIGTVLPESLTAVCQEIPARSGPPHGKLCVAGCSDRQTGAAVEVALSIGVRLAALAIDTRGLYSDLVHRSEFDMLTDVHNRFALEKRLTQEIADASREARILGLLFIDLDDFKQVNDNYGHHVGDVFLQHAASRMKNQLRPCDMLARMGGDEFGVLVPSIRNRAELEEIAGRLQRTFDDPFVIENYELRASASIGIAAYPQDGETQESLLTTADAAMYVAKHTK